MSNDEYMKLYEQYQNMIIMLARKYAKLNLIEYEDLLQVAMITLVKCYNNYDANKGMSFSTYLYSNIEFAIKNELRKVKHQDRNCVSLQTALFDAEGKEITLEDTLQDNIDIQAETEDKIMVQIYRDEIIRCLDPRKADVMILKYFENMPNNYIEKVLNITGVSNYIRESRMTLIRKSSLFMAEYRRIHNINEYSNPANAII